MGLRRMTLRDFVIVRELELEPDAGFTVLTGETGAGKSILVDALQFVLGARADAMAIREGAGRSEVSAEFDGGDAPVSWLDEAGFDPAEALLLRRSVDTQGRSRAWINGSPATAAQLRELAEHLVDIHGQHAWQSLTRAESTRELLDAYAAVSPAGLAQPWKQWRAAQKALEDARGMQESLQQERDRLAWQIAEVSRLAPGDNEWDELNASHARLANAQSLLDAAAMALSALDDEPGAATALARALDALSAHTRLEPEFAELATICESSLAQARDAAHSLQSYLRRTEPDPARLAELDRRVEQWVGLARRYRRLPEELPTLLASWQQELAQLESATDVDALAVAAGKAQQEFLTRAQALSAARRKAAPKLGKAVTQAMQGLGMQGGKFEVALREEEASASGIDGIEFLVAGHAGSTPRPVGKVASGGELSRIALAIAVTTSRLGAAPTLIFDEVDAGIGGAVAETVGRLMKQLGRDRQVLAVTHLPQVAACADHHAVVSKRADAKGASSAIAMVEGEQRIAEIARMLGGERLSGATLSHAREMLDFGAGAEARP